MAHRTFIDDVGVPWDVWEVLPQWTDRRTGEDRRKLSIDDPRVDPPVIEQRRLADRRSGSSTGTRRVKLAHGFSAGWLTFDSRLERRRLSPIPSGWETAPTSELAAMCSRAATVPGTSNRTIEERA
jgi:hypothetical protein